MRQIKSYGRALLCCLLMIAILAALPVPALAAEKYMEGESADFQIYLDETGGATIVETWNCFFGGDTISRYRRNYHIPDADACSFEVSEVRMDDEPMTLLDGPDGSRPEGCAAVYQEGQDIHIEMYLSALNESHSFTISYYVSNAVILYNDVAEFHWDLSSEHEAFDIEEVTAYIEIPYGTQDMGLYFWGHGPEDSGYFDADVEDGMVNQFNLYTEYLPKDETLGVRFAMPLELFPDGTRFVDEDALDRILEEEHELAGIYDPDDDMMTEEDLTESTWDDDIDDVIYEDTEWTWFDELSFGMNVMFAAVFGIWSIVSLVLCVVPFALILSTGLMERRARKHYLPKQYEQNRLKPRQAPTYYRTLPDQLKPAMVYELMTVYPIKGEGKEILKKGNSFSATIMDLVERGLIEMGRDEENEVTYLVTDAVNSAELTDYERNIIELYSTAGADRVPMTTKEITRYMRENYNWCKTQYQEFDPLVKSAFAELDLTTEFPHRDMPKPRVIAIAVVEMLVIFVGIAHLVGFLPGLIVGFFLGGLNGIAVSVAYNTLHPDYRILKQNAEDHYALWQAYKRYLEDFTTFQEREVTDIKIWRKYLVYATALGCSEKVIENLKMELPEVYESFRDDPYLYGFEDLSSSVSQIDTEGGYTIRSSSSSGGSDSSDSGDWGGFSSGGGDSDSGSSGSDFD